MWPGFTFSSSRPHNVVNFQIIYVNNLYWVTWSTCDDLSNHLRRYILGFDVMIK